jgi:hypothetical protein
MGPGEVRFENRRDCDSSYIQWQTRIQCSRSCHVDRRGPRHFWGLLPSIYYDVDGPSTRSASQSHDVEQTDRSAEALDSSRVSDSEPNTLLCSTSQAVLIALQFAAKSAHLTVTSETIRFGPLAGCPPPLCSSYIVAASAVCNHSFDFPMVPDPFGFLTTMIVNDLMPPCFSLSPLSVRCCLRHT